MLTESLGIIDEPHLQNPDEKLGVVERLQAKLRQGKSPKKLIVSNENETTFPYQVEGFLSCPNEFVR